MRPALMPAAGTISMANARITLPVEGMTCGACAVTVQKRLGETPGVKEASVTYATGKATVTVEGRQVRVRDLGPAVRRSGYRWGRGSVTFPVENLPFGSGVAGLERALGALPGVLRANANQAAETATVEYV